MNKNSRIAITGASGFVGRNLVQTLLDEGFENLLLLVRDSSKVKFSGIDIKEVDLVNPQELKEVLRGVDVLFHTAANVSFSDCRADEIIEENVEITSHVVDAVIDAGVNKIVHTSSIAALSGMKAGKIYIDESCLLDNFATSSPYAKSKFLSEQQIFKAKSAGVKTIVVQPGVIIGEGSQMFEQLKCGMRFYTTGVTGFVDVKDVARAQVKLAQIPEAEGENFVLVSENLSFKDVFSLFADAHNMPRPKIGVNLCFMKFIANLEGFLFKIFGREPKLSRSTVRAAFAKNFYNGLKICNFIDFKYTSIKRSCEQQ